MSPVNKRTFVVEIILLRKFRRFLIRKNRLWDCDSWISENLIFGSLINEHSLKVLFWFSYYYWCPHISWIFWNERTAYLTSFATIMNIFIWERRGEWVEFVALVFLWTERHYPACEREMAKQLFLWTCTLIMVTWPTDNAIMWLNLVKCQIL